MELAASVLIVGLQVCLIAGIIAFLVRIVPWAMTGHMDSPFVPTRGRVLAEVARALECGEGDIVYELGSGDGRFLLTCARLSPKSRYVGIERNPVLYALALVRKRLAGNPSNVTFQRKDFFDVGLRDATKIYLYLLPGALDRLQQKFERELRGVRVVSCAFRFSGKNPIRTITLPFGEGLLGQHLLYVYEF